MRNLNEVFLAGTLKYPTFYAPGDVTPKGKSIKFPMMSAQLVFPNVSYWSYRLGQEVTIGRQATWVDISPPQRNGKLDVDTGRRWKATVEQGHIYATLVGATFNLDRQQKGRLKVSLSNLTLSNQRPDDRPLNLVILGGTAHVTDAHRFTLEERYINPFEKDKSKQWRSRYVPVSSPRPLASLHRQTVLVFGTLSSRDMNGNEYLHVIAEDVR